ncbi:hypothetical protein UWK_00130 [Desulfocapsa sulfexigens DSM 10523]|uniref:Uncharacterized protein n=1 Tax=Desulfocapsa sulfexigens (strain DSM 10523 / SB164P1) TaxID=1167006 RepID=M1P4T1_DESSD|nr:hypothetical protein [Desulfocapsa sulfexigens]AGF76717.1 hypothetical protein UWK_00130 [Desulfocapsa sulfexigens DSM 10523]
MKTLSLWLMLFVFSSCSMMQGLTPPKFPEGRVDSLEIERCKQTFVTGKWQFVHSISFEMANGHGATVIGVTVLDGETLKTGLMGVEGFVLFEAELAKENKLDIRRALPPFDNAEFALGLMRDVKTVFLLPPGEAVATGESVHEGTLCRYVDESGHLSDVLIELNGSRGVNVYDSSRKRTRSIWMEEYHLVAGAMIPEKIQLKAHGIRGYTLDMKLISADKI